MCNVAIPNECRLKSYNIVQFYLYDNQKQAKIVSSVQQDSVTMEKKEYRDQRGYEKGSEELAISTVSSSM